MASQEQIDANRRNAQKSTGPRTPEGRAAVRLNGVKHGLTAKTLVLQGESESEYEALFDSLEAEHQPSTPTEELLVSQLAMAAWRLRRLYRVEGGYYTHQMKEMADYARRYNVDGDCLLGMVSGSNIDTFGNIGRQEARLQRIFDKALQILLRLRAQRPATVAAPPPAGLGLVCNQPEIRADNPSGSQVNGIPQPPPAPAASPGPS